MTERKIIVEFGNPPIPSRNFDYNAVFDGYEPGDLVGYGATEEAAKADLIIQSELDKSGWLQP